MLCDNCKKLVEKVSERVIVCKYRGKTHPRAKKCNKCVGRDNDD